MNELHIQPVIDSENKRAGSDFSAFNVVLGLLLAAIIANHLLWVWHYAIPVPSGDDYVIILNRLIIFHDLPPDLSFSEKLGFFIGFSGGQHRLVFLNSVIVVLYKIVGNIDFHTLVLIGSSSLIALLWGLWKYAGSVLPISRNRIAYFLPVALLILSPAYFEASLWTTGVLQNLPVLAFAFFAIAYASQRSGFFFLVALFAALLATCTAASGMAVFLACAAVLVAQRRFAHAFIMVLLFIAVAWVYTRGFPNDPSIPVTTSPSELIRFFLALCGALVWGKNGAIFLGVLLVAGFGVLTWQGLPKRNPVLWGLGLFVLLSMAMMSLGRAGFGVEAALLSRYKPYSGLMLVVIYLGSVIHVPSLTWKKFLGFFGLLISSAVFVSSLIHYNAAITDLGFLPKLRMAYRAIEGKVHVLSGFPGTDFSNHVIDTAERYGMYRPPSFSELVAIPVPPSKGVLPSTLKQQKAGYDHLIYQFIDGEKAALIYGGSDKKCTLEPLRLVLKSGAQTLYFEMQPPDWGWLNIYHDHSKHGFFGGIVDKRSLPAGLYQLGMTCGDAPPTFWGNGYRVSKNP
ncbi:hypothetical protein [Candidatus Nitrotoga arctica]|uniref:hypothetical protein n=1 Tax=Candidatus Nitrotoga arctica TaxID=453162 RepID=UPI001EFBBE2A|nr:hypothetical protein [Candidatus Nitrotoga arctica]